MYMEVCARLCVCVWENCIMCGINSHRLPFVRTTSTSLTFIGFGGHSHLMLTTCSAPQPPFETPCATVQSVLWLFKCGQSTRPHNRKMICQVGQVKVGIFQGWGL